MGSVILGTDKIGALTEAGGTISLGPSVLTIGGRQYRTSTLNVAATSAGLNNLQFIYVVLNSGVPELAISTNVNSIGPVGFLVWKLVGAYYSDGLGNSFGGFVNIEGSPKSEWIKFNMVPTSSTPPTKGSIDLDEAFWKLTGESIKIKWDYRQLTAGSAGSGTYQLPFPSGFIAGAKQVGSNSQNRGNIGNCSLGTASNNYDGYVHVNSSLSELQLIIDNSTTNNTPWAASTFPFSDTALGISFTTKDIPIAGLTNLPLKDL